MRRGGVPQTVVHPFSWISPSARIGAGTVVFGGGVVNADTEVGESCILNTDCSVDHEGSIGSHSHWGAGARVAGAVRSVQRTRMGSGSECIPGIVIVSAVSVGAGSIVVRDLTEKSRAFGNPARARQE